MKILNLNFKFQIFIISGLSVTSFVFVRVISWIVIILTAKDDPRNNTKQHQTPLIETTTDN
jgi:hypothetical protein